jgi:putative ABC transport system ATP-binding protein
MLSWNWKVTGKEYQSRHLVDVRRVEKVYAGAAGEFPALRGISLQLERGDFAAVVGKSGSGKSTLLNILTGIDRPTAGEVWVDGAPLHRLSEGQLAAWRGREVGIVFQFFQLLPALSIVENVMLPMDFGHTFPRSQYARAMRLLDQMEMAEHARKLPSALSGGQQQRAAIARALANDPPILVADEPTGNLDSQTAEAVFQLFAGLAGQGKTVIMVTHDPELARRAAKIFRITDGRILCRDDRAARIPEEAVHDYAALE